MRKAVAVIGANYGDEGKGASTHFLTKKLRPNVAVRFNGGPQAGHTVQATIFDKVKRHIFSSYSSTCMAYKCPTYLSALALFQPGAAVSEREALKNLGFDPRLVVDPDTHIITPWDAALNQFIELGRADNRNGSCGMGIGETMLRKVTKDAPTITLVQLKDPLYVANFIIQIRAWFTKRVHEEARKGSFTYLSEIQQGNLFSYLRYPSDFISVLYSYAKKAVEFESKSLLRLLNEEEGAEEGVGTVIFEGAQGLLLDEDDPHHQPHVTWSKTGVTNVIKECTDNGLQLTDIYYVTRPYLTRHGRGPILAGEEIPQEKVLSELGHIEDETNKPNDYQEASRFAHLDWDKFKDRILEDAYLASKFSPQVSIILTCEDQFQPDTDMHYLHKGQFSSLPFQQLPEKIRELTGLPVISINGLRG